MGSTSPGRVVGNLDGAVQLMRADPFLAGGHQVERKRPFGQRNFAALHDVAGADGELTAAVAAMEQPGAMHFALHPKNAAIAAMDTGYAARPALGFEPIT